MVVVFTQKTLKDVLYTCANAALQGRSKQDVTVLTSTQSTTELYSYQPIQIDWLGPDPPSVSDLISSDRYYELTSLSILVHCHNGRIMFMITSYQVAIRFFYSGRGGTLHSFLVFFNILFGCSV